MLAYHQEVAMEQINLAIPVWALWVISILPILAKILNAITVHYSEKKGLVKVLLLIIDILDLFKTTPKR